MADINVERKGPSIWPWIIGLLVVALLIWALAEMLGDDDELVDADVTEEVVPVVPPVTPEEPIEGALVVPPVVEEYMNTCTGAEADVALDHTYTAGCINSLTASVDALVEDPDFADVDLSAQLEDYRQRADLLVQSPEESEQHANWTREAFISMADLLNTAQDARFPTLDAQVAQLEEAAESVQGDVLMTEQGPAVQSFFRQAGDILQAMATTEPMM